MPFLRRLIFKPLGNSIRKHASVCVIRKTFRLCYFRGIDLSKIMLFSDPISLDGKRSKTVYFREFEIRKLDPRKMALAR